MISNILASFFTGIAGHYINRRWDKAILFLSVFILYGTAIYFYFIYLMTTGISESSGDFVSELPSLTSYLSKTFSIGIFVLWTISGFVAFLDAKREVEPNITKWTSYGVMGAVFTSLFSTILLLFSVTMFVTASEFDIFESNTMPDNHKVTIYDQHNFYEYLRLGGSPNGLHELSAPPTGAGVFRGQILYQEKGAEGVTLSVTLNSKHEVKGLVTDFNGVFEVNLTPGEWVVNAIQTTAWKNKPKGKTFAIYNGDEEKLGGDSYNVYGKFNEIGYPVNVTSDAAIIHLTATIADDVQLIWPDPNVKGVKASIEDTVSWKKHPEASRYYVDLKKLRREGSTTHYEGGTSKVISGVTSLPLSSLKHVGSDNNEGAEYSVEIYAFAADGTLIAESTDTFRGSTFVLEDGNVLLDDKQASDFGLSSIENAGELKAKVEAISLNTRREVAVTLLIEENMLSEAELLLTRIDSSYSRGKKEMLSGYIHALQGDCKKATDMFDKASAIDFSICIPKKYKEICN